MAGPRPSLRASGVHAEVLLVALATFIPAAVAAFSLGLLALALRLSRRYWIGFPLAVIALRMLIQGGIAPMITDPTQQIKESYYVMPVKPQDLPGVIGVVVLSYLLIAVGMIFVGGLKRTPVSGTSPTFDARTLHNARMVSWFVFGVGLAGNLAALWILLQGGSIGALASERAMFTDPVALRNPVYGNAVTISSWMQWGALGIMLFNGGRRANVQAGVGGVALNVILFMLHGSRASTILLLVSTAAVYHFGVRRLSLKKVAVLGVMGVIALGALTVHRRGYDSIGDGVQDFIYSVFSDTTVAEVGSVFYLFPDRIDFLHGKSFLIGIGAAFPGVEVDAVNPFHYVAGELHGRGYVRGGGGETFPMVAEAYMNYGYPGVVVVPLLVGLLFGFLFRRCQGYRENPFVLLFATVLWLKFIPAIDAKTPIVLGGSLLGAVLPLAIIVTFCEASGKYVLFKMFFWSSALVFVAWRVSGNAHLKIVLVSAMFLVHALALRALLSPLGMARVRRLRIRM